ncbi:MAG: hypothetical protein AAFY88_27835, partial [Acidobacteriota bacterium]
AAAIVTAAFPAHADTTWDARGEWLHLPAGEKAIIPIADLLANDVGAPGGTYTVRVLSGAAEASELPVGAGNRLAIDAEALEYGELAFTYELQSTVGASAVVTSVVSLVPALQPVTGDWESMLTSPSDDSENAFGFGGGRPICEIGDGAEIGWYQSRRATFMLCDFTGGFLPERCTEWRTPAAALGPVSDFRIARVADWDGDGVDEPALYDPTLGELQTFDYGTCYGSICYLQASALLTVGADGAMGLPGDWQAGVFGFSTYRLLSSQFTDTAGQITTWGAPTLEARPVVGDWTNNATDSLGLWHDSTAELHYLADSTGQGGGVIQAIRDGAPVRGYAFTGRWSDCGIDGEFLGLQEGELLTLLPLSPSLPQRGLHVKVVVDPGGGD